MKLVTANTYYSEQEAELEKQLLERNNIKSVINSSRTIVANPLLATALGGFELQCLEQDLSEAIKILNLKK